jgi:hypothetical protein
LIELPGNKNDKRWRNALRTLMLLEVFFFDGGRSQKDCITQTKQNSFTFPTQTLENLITRMCIHTSSVGLTTVISPSTS